LGKFQHMFSPEGETYAWYDDDTSYRITILIIFLSIFSPPFNQLFWLAKGK